MVLGLAPGTFQGSPVHAQPVAPGVTVSETSLDIVEGNSDTYDVELDAVPAGDVTVIIGGITGTDLALDKSSLTFTDQNWNTRQTVTVSATADDDAIHDSATLTHTASGGGYDSVSADLPVTVTDTTRVELAPVIESVPEGESRPIRAALSMPLDEDVTITVEVTPDSSRAGEYELSANTTLTIAAGATESTGEVIFTSLDDFTYRGTHYFRATLSSDHPRVDSSFGAFSVVEDDHTIVGWEVAPSTIFENGGEATLRAFKHRLHEGVVKMAVSLEPSDRATLNGTTLTFLPGALYATETLTITAVDNAADEPDQTITISATVTEGRGIRTPTPLELTIVDDDLMSPEVALVLTPPRVREGLVSTVTAVTSGPLDDEATITVSASPGHADTRPDDFVLSANTVLTIPAGGTTSTGTVTIATVDDPLSAGSRSRVVTVSGTMTGGGGVADPADQSLTVLEDDPRMRLHLITTPSTIEEGEVSTITLRAVQPVPADVTVTVMHFSDAVELSADPVLMIAAGETESTGVVTLTALEDTDMDNEFISLRGSPSADSPFVSVASNQVYILDNDLNHAVLAVSPVPRKVIEGGTSTIIANLSQPLPDDVTITINIDEANPNHFATADDFTLSPNRTLTIPAGSMRSTGVVTLTSTDDEYYGPGSVRRVALDFSATGHGGPVFKVSDWHILEDEAQPRVTLAVAPATISENGGQSTVTVSLNTIVEADVAVTVTTRPDAAAEPDDFTQTGSLLTIPAGQKNSTGTVTITSVDDDDDGPDKNLVVTATVEVVGMEKSGLVWFPYDEGLTIQDDDEADLVLSKASLGPSEGGSESYTVALATRPSAQVTVTITGHADTDLTPDPTILMFTTTDWATAKTVTVEAGHDDDTVNDSATLTHTAAGGGYASVAADLPVTVHDDDADTDPLMETDTDPLMETDPDPLVPCIDNNRANIVTVLSEHGMISSPGEVDTWVIPGVDPFRTYFVEILGADSSLDVWGQDVGGSLTLADPHPVSLYHEGGNPGGHGFNSAPGDFGTGGNSRFIFVFSMYGDYVLKVKSGESADDQGIGSYHVLVRYDTYCIENDDGNAVFPFEGGPEGYAFDIRADVSTRFTEYERYSSADQRTHYFAGGHLLGDNWGSEPDEDWYGFELKGSTEYEVYLEGSDHFPVEHRLMRPRITGIYDKDGVLFQEGEAGSGTDPSVTLTFRTAGSGKYYLGVGSNPGGRTGVYNYRVSQTEPDTAGHASTNNSPTGGPSITGLPRIGEVLTATTSGIADADGLENSSFSYQWVRHDPLANSDTDIPGATGSTYTVTRQDQDRAIKVRVEFTDDGGNDEKLTSFAFLISPPVNTRAAGQPTITGTLEVGQTLTADTSRISDTDRKDNATFGYQWIAGDSDIQNATGMSHTLTENEEGLAIRVSVTFTDDAGNETTLTSSPTEPVEPAAKGSSDPDATRAGAVDLGDITSLAKARYPTYSVNGVDDVVDYFTFTITEPKKVQIGIRQLDADANLTLEHEDGTVIEHKSKPGEEHVAMYPTLLEGAYYVRVEAAEEGVNEYRMAHGVSEPNPDRVAELREKVRPLNRATGSPAIVGTAQVGEPLTADTSGIADADGLENVTFSFQWVASDGGADVDIAGATDSTYTVVAADKGLTIKVQVNFTDDAGTGAVAPVLPPLTVSLTVAAPATHDGSAEFTFEIEFSEEFPLSYKVLKLHAFDVTDGEVLKAQRVDKSSNISWRITVRPDSNADVTVALPVATDCDAQGSICTQDGRKLSNSLNFTVSGPNQ